MDYRIAENFRGRKRSLISEKLDFGNKTFENGRTFVGVTLITQRMCDGAMYSYQS